MLLYRIMKIKHLVLQSHITAYVSNKENKHYIAQKLLITFFIYKVSRVHSGVKISTHGQHNIKTN